MDDKLIKGTRVRITDLYSEDHGKIGVVCDAKHAESCWEFNVLFSNGDVDWFRASQLKIEEPESTTAGRPIAIACGGSVLYVLADDGTIWSRATRESDWHPLPRFPEGK